MRYQNILIEIKDLANKCPIHNKDISSYCTDCDKNICQECENLFHKEHNKIKKIDQSKIDKLKKEIDKKIKMLIQLKEFYRLVLNNYNSNHYNIIYKNNLINLKNSILNEKSRHENDIDLAIYIMEKGGKKLNKDTSISSSALKNYNFIQEPFQKMEHHQETGIIEIQKVYSNSGKIVLKDKIKNSNYLESKNNHHYYFDEEDIIMEKEQEILDIIKLYELILNLNKLCPRNFIFAQNVINVGEFIEKENAFSSEMDDIIQQEIKLKEKEKYAIEKLKSHYHFYLDDEIEFLSLKGEKTENLSKWLAKGFKLVSDEAFELISKIRFKNLIELNLSRNRISNLYPLENMNLPHLEIINLSENLIEDISPLANLYSYNLEEINLDKNKIKDLEPFLLSKFPLLKMLIVSNNPAIYNKNFKDILKKYKGIIYYENIELSYFCRKYDIRNYYNEAIKLDLSDKRRREILSDLYFAITFPNNIEALFLDDNNLSDVSLLTKLPLYNLKKLDLSFNLITNIKFLMKKYKWKNLNELYLNDKKIYDISPLKNLQIGLKILTLKNNYLDINDEETKNILLTFIEMGVIKDIDRFNKLFI